MHNRTKLFLFLVVMASLALLAAACGGNKQADGKKAPVVEAPKAEAAKPAQSAKAEPSATETKKEASKPDTAKPDSAKADTKSGAAKTDSSKTSSTKADAKTGAVDVSKAKAIMDKIGCTTCHTSSNKPLDKIGGKYNAAQLTEFFKNKHPVKFDLNDADLGTLTSYLSRLK